MATPGVSVPAGFRYQQLAAELEEKIRIGQCKAGERLPSLRTLHHRTGLSITTIAQAYMELESRGIVEAREKSGYFVRPLLQTVLPLPRTTEQPPPRPASYCLSGSWPVPHALLPANTLPGMASIMVRPMAFPPLSVRLRPVRSVCAGEEGRRNPLSPMAAWTPFNSVCELWPSRVISSSPSRRPSPAISS